MIAIEACQMWAIASSCSWKEGEGVTFPSLFSPLLSSVVSTHVIFQTVKAMGMDTGQVCHSPGRSSWIEGRFWDKIHWYWQLKNAMVKFCLTKDWVTYPKSHSFLGGRANSQPPSLLTDTGSLSQAMELSSVPESLWCIPNHPEVGGSPTIWLHHSKPYAWWVDQPSIMESKWKSLES